jgi:hypothetical protein
MHGSKHHRKWLILVTEQPCKHYPSGAGAATHGCVSNILKKIIFNFLKLLNGQ